MTPLIGGTQALRLKPLEAEAKARVSRLATKPTETITD